MVTKVAIGSDHAGYELKQYIIDNFNKFCANGADILLSTQIPK